MSSAHVRSWEPDSAGEIYELGRPDYPASVTSLIAREARLGPGSIVADLAAGTGKLTRVLAGGPARVVAVEPMAGMRAQLRRTVPLTAVCAATAEQLPFRDASLDAVTVAQAFHWFRVDEAARELTRVLVPRGRLILVTNTKEEEDLFSRRLWEILRSFEHIAPRPVATGRWRRELDSLGCFASWRRVTVSNEQIFNTAAELEARFTSISFVLLLGGEDRRRLTDALHAAAGDAYPIRMPLRTVVDIGERLP